MNIREDLERVKEEIVELRAKILPSSSASPLAVAAPVVMQMMMIPPADIPVSIYMLEICN